MIRAALLGGPQFNHRAVAVGRADRLRYFSCPAASRMRRVISSGREIIET